MIILLFANTIQYIVKYKSLEAEHREGYGNENVISQLITGHVFILIHIKIGHLLMIKLFELYLTGCLTMLKSQNKNANIEHDQTCW